VLDYSKYKYEQAQKVKQARKHQQQITIREIKFRPKIAQHDYDTKKGHVERFLRHKDKVKVTIMFRGREVTHPERGTMILDRLAEELGELGIVEQRPMQEGRNMTMMLGPSKAVLAGRVEGSADGAHPEPEASPSGPEGAVPESPAEGAQGAAPESPAEGAQGAAPESPAEGAQAASEAPAQTAPDGAVSGAQAASDTTPDVPTNGEQAVSEVAPDGPANGAQAVSDMTPDGPANGARAASGTTPDDPTQSAPPQDVVEAAPQDAPVQGAPAEPAPQAAASGD
jgi:translation initiation factor IF-3